MKKRVLIVAVATAVVISYGSSAWAFGYIGPPMSTSNKGQLGVNFGYNYNKMDLKVDEIKTQFFTLPSTTLHKTSSQQFFGDITYGFTPNWEGFVRLGANNTGEGAGNLAGRTKITGDTDLIWGLGTRTTFYKTPKWSVGAVFEVGRIDTDGKLRSGAALGKYNLEAWEYILAVGPTYNITDEFSLYGGGFVNYIDGEVDGRLGGLSVDADVELDNWFGGFVGAGMSIGENWGLALEYAMSEDIQSLSIVGSYRH